MATFAELLARTRHPLPHTPSHSLHLAAFLVLPPTPPPTGPISSIHPVSWSDTLNTQLLVPFTTLHAFLPLLATHKSSLLFLTPTVVPSLTPASHGLENVAAGGMQGYINTLPKEVRDTDIHIVQLKLGTFDLGVAPMSQALVSGRDVGREESAQGKSAKEDGAAEAARFRPAVKGSSLRELHLGVFDAIVRERGRSGTMFVGRGSRTYDFVSRWVPAGVVGWMLKGVGGNEEQEQQQRRRRRQPGTDDEKIPIERDGSSVEWEKVEREMGASAGGSAGGD